MQRWNWVVVCTLLFLLVLASLADAQAPAKKSPEKPVQPLTIRGTATNHENKPVKGAKVFIVPTNCVGDRAVIAETTTDAEGKYEFRETPLPLDVYDSLYSKDAKVTAGACQVFALANGYGPTWHPKLKFHVDPRPQVQSQKDVIYSGEVGRADLAFDLPAKLSGLVTNDRGQPLAGVKVQIGYCDDPRRPEGYGTWMCSYLGPEGDEVQVEGGRFDGIQHVPEKYRSVLTDEKGRYQFTQLRRDSQYLMLLDAAPECDPVQLSVATTKKEAAGRRSLGYDGEVNETFKTPWPFVVKVASADGQPQANVKIRVRGSRIVRAGRLATTDAAGLARLRLLADKYTFFLEPPYGSPYVLTEREVVVSPETSAEVNSLTLDAAATLLIRAVEEGSGKPVPGVSFVEEVDSGKRRQELQSQTVFVDHPVTDALGELRALVPPGERRLLVAKQPPGLEPVNKASELLKSPAKGSETVTFTFKKTNVAAAAASLVPEDEGEIGKLNVLILRQQELTKAGRFDLNSHFRPLDGVSAEELRSILAACDFDKVPNLSSLLRKSKPTVHIPFGRKVVVVDGEKTRNELYTSTPEVDPQPSSLMAYNGLETVDYSFSNAHAGVYSREGGGTQIGLTDSGDLTSWRPIFKIKTRPGADPIERKVTHEKGRIMIEAAYPKSTYRQVFDEKTGFLYHEVSLQDGGEFGSEHWQFAPRTDPSGGIVAGMTVGANYHKGQVTSLRIYEVRSYSLGAPPPDSFVISAPSGTMIVDNRGRQRSPKIGVVSEPITDVVARANQASDDSRAILDTLKDGDPAPAIEPATWLNADGPTKKLDWKGRMLLIDFWGTGCGPCIAELPSVQAFAEKFQKAGGVVLGLHDAGAEPAAVTEFVRKRGLTYQFAIDKPSPDGPSFGATFQAYGIRGIPNCAVIDQKGNVVFLGHFEEAAKRATALLEAAGK